MTTQSRTEKLITARTQNPAWVLLASHRAPLVIACLQSLFEDAQDCVLMDDALHALSAMLAAQANNEPTKSIPSVYHNWQARSCANGFAVP